MKRLTVSLALALACASFAQGADEPSYTRQEDVVYGRKDGTALTMDIFRPRTGANGSGVIVMVSGGFFSSHDAINPGFARPFLDRGYTVFSVVHGSQPRYTVPEIVRDVQRAVRFVRHHAKDYGIEGGRLGVTGASAGGHLSLMLGTADDTKDEQAKDPVDRESSRVQAVACFFPPTDLLNFGAKGKAMVHAKDHRKPFRPAFDYHELDKEQNVWVPITDEARLREITKAISPITHVSRGDAPTLMIHGDADDLVPVQQSQTMLEALEAVGVEAKLIVKPGAGHGWPTLGQEMTTFADWFDRHLKAAGTDAAATP
jgi:acetyl esterase/lipase